MQGPQRGLNISPAKGAQGFWILGCSHRMVGAKPKMPEDSCAETISSIAGLRPAPIPFTPLSWWMWLLGCERAELPHLWPCELGSEQVRERSARRATHVCHCWGNSEYRSPFTTPVPAQGQWQQAALPSQGTGMVSNLRLGT